MPATLNAWRHGGSILWSCQARTHGLRASRPASSRAENVIDGGDEILASQRLGHHALDAKLASQDAIGRQAQAGLAGERDHRRPRVYPLHTSDRYLRFPLHHGDAHDDEIRARDRTLTGCRVSYDVARTTQPLAQQAVHEVVTLVQGNDGHCATRSGREPVYRARGLLLAGRAASARESR